MPPAPGQLAGILMAARHHDPTGQRDGMYTKRCSRRFQTESAGAKQTIAPLGPSNESGNSMAERFR
jgi:hypothetical protein